MSFYFGGYSLEAIYKFQIHKRIYIWNKLCRLLHIKNGYLFYQFLDKKILNCKSGAYYNIDFLVYARKIVINIFFAKKFINISYLMVRLYIYMLQIVSGVQINLYMGGVKKKLIHKLIYLNYLKQMMFKLVIFLKQIKITRMFIIFFLKSIINRDILGILNYIRKVMISINIFRRRRFLFLFHIFFKKLLYFLKLYCGLKSYKVEVNGKLGRGGAERTKKYILKSCIKDGKISNYYCYNYLQVRLILGIVSLRGYLIY